MSSSALHASAPEGHKCADCTIDEEPCPTCYAAWWRQRHPNHSAIVITDLKGRHKELHQELDELLACYLVQTKRTISDTMLMDFLKWSHLMTETPTCEAHGGEDSGVAPRSTDGL